MEDQEPSGGESEGGGEGAGPGISTNPDNPREAAAGPADAEHAQDPGQQTGGGQHGG